MLRQTGFMLIKSREIFALVVVVVSVVLRQHYSPVQYQAIAVTFCSSSANVQSPDNNTSLSCTPALCFCFFVFRSHRCSRSHRLILNGGAAELVCLSLFTNVLPI